MDENALEFDLVLLQDLHHAKKVDVSCLSSIKFFFVQLQLMFHWLKNYFVLLITSEKYLSPILIPFKEIEVWAEKNCLNHRMHKIFYFEQLILSALQSQQIETKGIIITIIEDFTKQWSIAVFEEGAFYFKRTCLVQHLQQEIFSTISYLKEHCHLDSQKEQKIYFFSNDSAQEMTIEGWKVKKIPYHLESLLKAGIKSRYSKSFYMPLRLFPYALKWSLRLKKATCLLFLILFTLLISMELPEFFINHTELQYYIAENNRLQRKPEHLDFLRFIHNQMIHRNPYFEKVLAEITTIVEVKGILWKPSKNHLILSIENISHDEKEKIAKKIGQFLKRSIRWGNEEMEIELLCDQKGST